MSDNTKDAVPKVVDFGLVKMIGPGEKAKDSLGTLAYAAPEVIISKNYDTKCDVWSLGVVLHLMLIGQYPYMDQREDELARQIILAPVSFKSSRWEKVTKQAQLLVEDML